MSFFLPLLSISDFAPLLTLMGVGGVLGSVFALAFSLDQNNLKTTLYPIFATLMGMLLGVILHYGSVDDPMNLPWIYIGLQFLVLFLGSLHLWWMYKKLFWSKRDTYSKERDSFSPEFTYTMYIMVMMSAGMLAGYGYFSGFGKMANYWAINILFIAPFLFIKAYDFLNQVPYRDFAKKWTFTKDRIDEDNWEWNNEMWVHFEVRETVQAERLKKGRMSRFRILAPRRVPLREIYRLGVREYNKKAPQVVLQDLGFEIGNDGQFWWLFKVKTVWNRPNTWFRRVRYLDPFSSPVVNDMRPNDILIMYRMALTPGLELDYSEIAMGEM
jgi:Type VI secretion system, TssN